MRVVNVTVTTTLTRLSDLIDGDTNIEYLALQDPSGLVLFGGNGPALATVGADIGLPIKSTKNIQVQVATGTQVLTCVLL